MQRTYRHRVCSLVPVVILLAGAGTSDAQFVREEISIRVRGSNCMLEGTYEFRNTQDHTALWPIFYPLLNTATITPADSIHIRDGETGEPIPFERESNGASFSVSMPPRGPKRIQITYRQQTPNGRMEYILTSTKQWGRPLDLATFRVLVPDSLRLTHISMPYDSLTTRGHDVEYFIRRKVFMPRSNLVITWERRQR